VPIEALHAAPAIDGFIRRVEFGIADGGFDDHGTPAPARASPCAC